MTKVTGFYLGVVSYQSYVCNQERRDKLFALEGRRVDYQAAAAGAIFGALTQNQNGTTTQKVITGYENRSICNNVSVPTQVSNSSYIIHWKSGHRRGSFYSDSKYVVGDSVYVRN